MRRSAHGASGFTLVELLISAMISLSLGAAGFLLVRTQLRSLMNQSAGLDAIEGARAALDLMASDIRMTGANVSGASRWVGSGTCIGKSSSFTAVWDDGISANGSAPNHTVRYWYDATNKRIVRTIAGVDATLIPNVPASGLVFQYLSNSGAAAAMSGSPSQVTSCDDVAVVQVSVAVTAARAAQTFIVNLGSRVTLRNRSNTLTRM